MKFKKNIIRWLLPIFLGTMMFNILRVITDLTIKNRFWQGDMQPHLVGLFFSIVLCYIMDFIWRYRLKKMDKSKSVVREYLFVFLELLFLSTVYLLLGDLFGVFFIQNILNYTLILVSYMPFLMLYYTLIRNDIVNKNYQRDTLLLEKLKVDKLETELKFLKSQYHPHFLFNALNTIYFQVDEENKEAKQSIEQLSDLLRYQLYDIEEKVSMEQEINYLKSYIAFQQLRMSNRLVLDMYFDSDLKEQRIHPLLFLPLIENAFKYVRGEYIVKLELKLNESQIQFNIENTISPNYSGKIKGSGIGIENLRRRLDILYPNKHSLEIKQTENKFAVELTIETD